MTANLATLCVPPPPLPIRSAVESVSHRGKEWPVGTRLAVGWFDAGNVGLRNRILNRVSEWLRHANLFLTAPAAVSSQSSLDLRIRVTQVAGPSWSYIGTDARLVPPDQPTMQLSVREDTPEESFAYLVLHEFGHALGFDHEWKHPEGQIIWDRLRVYADLGRSLGWSQQQVDDYLRPLDLQMTNSDRGPADADSVMNYQFPPEWTRGTWLPKASSRLSIRDQNHARRLYPGGTAVSPFERWLTLLYQDYLGREPAAAELRTWENYIAGGQGTEAARQQVAGLIALSDEARQVAASRAFVKRLGRPAQPHEAAIWSRAKPTPTEIDAAIAGSNEAWRRLGG